MKYYAITIATIILLIETQPVRALDCGPAGTTYQKSQALTSNFSGALLLLEKADSGPSAPTSVFYSGCYSLNPAARNSRVDFSINNQSTSKGTHYIAIQIIKIRSRRPNERPSTHVTANRSDTHDWYRGTTRTYFSVAPKTVTRNIKTWNDANDEYDVIMQNDRVLRGKWHGAVQKNGNSTWDNREWWKIDPDVQDRFQVVFENRLAAYDVATGDTASGIPFYFTPQGFDAFIVRYASDTKEQNGMVRFCFSLCDEINDIPVEPVELGFLSSLFRR